MTIDQFYSQNEIISFWISQDYNGFFVTTFKLVDWTPISLICSSLN